MTNSNTNQAPQTLNAAISASHVDAAQAASDVLDAGGNAFDAAVGAAFALQVAQPHRCGFGGEAVATLWSTTDGAPRVVCGQGPLPAGADSELFEDLGLETVPRTGSIAATVPGSFSALLSILRRWGTCNLRTVLEPAIALAKDGVEITESLRGVLESSQPTFRQHWPWSQTAYRIDSDSKAGARLRQPVLAQFLTDLVRDSEASGMAREQQIDAAHGAWYQGFVAHKVEEFCAQARVLNSSGERHFGLLDAEDFSSWSATIEVPLEVEFRGTTICLPGWWSTGGAIGQALKMLDGVLPPRLVEDDTAWMHQFVECLKLCLADQLVWAGDTDVTTAKAAGLLERDYVVKRAASITDQASFQLTPGDPTPDEGPAPYLPKPGLDNADGSLGAVFADPKPVDFGAGAVVCITDSAGNSIALACSGGTLQHSPALPELGFPLGTAAGTQRLQPGCIDSLAPGGMPVAAMAPALLLREGVPVMTCAVPGVDQQVTRQALALVRLSLLEDISVKAVPAAVNVPVLTVEHGPRWSNPYSTTLGRVWADDRWGDELLEKLATYGHDIVKRRGVNVGAHCVTAIGDGWLAAGTDAESAESSAISH